MDTAGEARGVDWTPDDEQHEESAASGAGLLDAIKAQNERMAAALDAVDERRVITTPPAADGTVWLPMAQISLNGGTQSRDGLYYPVVGEYTDAMRGGADFPPILVYHDGQSYWLVDGFHRFEAQKSSYHLNGVHDNLLIRCIVRQGTQRDAILASVGVNATHGLRRTPSDKKRAVARLLRDSEWSQWSDRKIAEHCAVSHPFVASVRRELKERDEAEKHRAERSAQVGASGNVSRYKDEDAGDPDPNDVARMLEEERLFGLKAHKSHPAGPIVRTFERGGQTHTMNTAAINADRKPAVKPAGNIDRYLEAQPAPEDSVAVAAFNAIVGADENAPESENGAGLKLVVDGKYWYDGVNAWVRVIKIDPDFVRCTVIDAGYTIQRPMGHALEHFHTERPPKVISTEPIGPFMQTSTPGTAPNITLPFGGMPAIGIEQAGNTPHWQLILNQLAGIKQSLTLVSTSADPAERQLMYVTRMTIDDLTLRIERRLDAVHRSPAKVEASTPDPLSETYGGTPPPLPPEPEEPAEESSADGAARLPSKWATRAPLAPRPPAMRHGGAS